MRKKLRNGLFKEKRLEEGDESFRGLGPLDVNAREGDDLGDRARGRMLASV